jgi:hypothetical protein
VDEPVNDKQFASFFLDPLLAHLFGSLGIPVAPAPRTDLLPLVQYMDPIVQAAVRKMPDRLLICFD